jgi:tetratricopeptide (TPR) repeat protein
MLSGRNKELQRIVELREIGKTTEYNKKLAEFEQKNHRPETNIRTQLVKTFYNIIDEKSWGKGVEILEPLISTCETFGNPLLLVDALYLKARALCWNEQYKESIELVEDTVKLLKKNSNPEDDDYNQRLAYLLWNNGFSYNMMGENKLARKTTNQALTYAKKTNDSMILLWLYDLLGMNEYQLAEYEKALIHHQTGYQLAKEAKNDQMIKQFCFRLTEDYGSIGNIEQSMKYCDLTIEWWKKHNQPADYLLAYKALLYWNIGEMVKSVEIYKKTLPTLEKFTTLWGKAQFLRSKAFIEWVEGSLDKAIEYMTEAIDLVKKRDDVFRSTILSVQLAPMLFDKGKFDQALEICFSGLEVFKENKNPYFEALIFETMGNIYHVKGDYNLALEYCQKSFKLWKKFKAPIRIVYSLFLLIQISIDKKDELYTKYLKELGKFVKNQPTEYFNQIYQTAQALELKASSRPRNWMKAADILEKVVDEKIIKHGVTIIALINLCEILMNEFSISGDIYVLEELELYSEKLSEIAMIENIHHLKIEASNLQIMILWIKAQHSLVEIDIQKARNLLHETRKIADEKGLQRLAEKLTQQQELLLNQLSQWDGFIRKYYEFIEG